MERKLVVLLLEDNQLECQEIIDYVATVEDVQIVGATGKVSEAMECVRHFSPDAVILDLELHKGDGNGIDFLKQLKELHLLISPYILVTTNNTSLVTYECARELGADFIIAKCQGDYSAKSVVEFLRSIKDILINRVSPHGSSPEITLVEPSNQSSKGISERINIELDLIGISPKVLGRKYLADSITLAVNKSPSNISTIIGTKYNKTNVSVERAMQSAINTAWRTSDIDDLSKHYTAKIKSEKGVPTLMEFIFYYANKIKENC